MGQKNAIDAIQHVLSVGLEQVKLCQAALKQQLITDSDMLFLAAYAKVMKPLALAVTLLQGDKTDLSGSSRADNNGP